MTVISDVFEANELAKGSDAVRAKKVLGECEALHKSAPLWFFFSLDLLLAGGPDQWSQIISWCNKQHQERHPGYLPWKLRNRILTDKKEWPKSSLFRSSS